MTDHLFSKKKWWSLFLKKGAFLKMQQVITLKLNKEFKRAYFQGKFKAHPLLVTYRVKNRAKTPRIGITTSKKIGCAVKRNRARRVIMAAYRMLLNEDPALFSSCDYVFVARPQTPDATSAEVMRIMKKHVQVLSHG